MKPANRARSLFAPRALLPSGWAEDVLVEIDEAGKITQVKAGEGPPAHAPVLRERVLLPALCNLHSHSFQRALSGLTEAQAAPSAECARDNFWSWRELMYRFVDQLRPEQLEAIAALAFLEMLECGFAAVAEFHYVHHQAGGTPYDNLAELSSRVAAAAETTGIGLTLLPVLYQQAGVGGQPLERRQRRFGNSLDSYLALWERAESTVKRQLPRDCRVGWGLHSLRAVPLAGVQAIDQASRDLPIHIHIAEQTAEVEALTRATGCRPVEYLLGQVDVDARWCLVHATHVSDHEVQKLSASGAVVGLCPITEANLGDGCFPVRDFAAASGRFGIGSDSNVRISVTEELRLLEYGQRLKHQQRNISAPEGGSTGTFLYESALLGGAQALGRASGALKVGHWADLVALDPSCGLLTHHAECQLLDGWVFGAGDRIVTDVWSAGRHVVEQGRHVAAEEVRARFQAVLGELMG